MIIYNSLVINNLVFGDKLYLVRYSQRDHPDYINVTYKGIKNDTIIYFNESGLTKKISVYKALYRLFSNEDEMSRSLYECFVKRNVLFNSDYKRLFKQSQDNRPELWV